MKLVAPLLIVIVACACTSEARSSEPPVVAKPTPASTDVAGTANPIEKTSQAALCVYTDPGKRPISVHRALSCPDGTQVAVRGIIIGASGGSVLLCDDVSGDVCLTIEGGVLPIVPGALPSTATDYTGTVSRGILRVGAAPLAETGGSVLVSPLSRPSSPLRSA